MFKPSEEMKRFVVAWRAAAIADGWEHTATYGLEPIERACRLKREGFLVSILTREPWEGNKSIPATKSTEYSINAWGPDGLSLKITALYSFEDLKRNLLLCGECGKYSVSTSRVAFVNRVCPKCIVAARKKYETKGWCD
jgi:hypothetical protein